MANETESREEWHVQHHARGFRSIFSTEEEARAHAGAGDTVTKFVIEPVAEIEREPELDDDLVPEEP